MCRAFRIAAKKAAKEAGNFKKKEKKGGGGSKNPFAGQKKKGKSAIKYVPTNVALFCTFVLTRVRLAFVFIQPPHRKKRCKVDSEKEMSTANS